MGHQAHLLKCCMPCWHGSAAVCRSYVSQAGTCEFNTCKTREPRAQDREAVAVILDDSSSVWAAHIDNLLTVERYVFFPSSARQLRLAGPSLLELSR